MEMGKQEVEPARADRKWGQTDRLLTEQESVWRTLLLQQQQQQ